jgi:hypothetical protein
MSGVFVVPVVKTHALPDESTRAGWTSIGIDNPFRLQNGGSGRVKALTMRFCRTLHAPLMPIQQYSENH